MKGDNGQPIVHGSVVEFVENYLSLVYRRDVTDHARRAWCPEWWKHAEAVARLDCLWRAWEHLRTDGRTGMSIWFLDHADPHMAQLFHPDGPFKFCSITKGHRDTLQPLPVKSPLKGLFSEPVV